MVLVAVCIFCIVLTLTCTSLWCLCFFTWLGSQFKGVFLFTTGIVLSLSLTAVNDNKKVMGCFYLFTRNPDKAARIKIIILLLVGVIIKLLAKGLGVDIWADAYLAFNSALAGVYAAQGWPTNAGEENNNKPQS